MKHIQAGQNIFLTCTFVSNRASTTAWFKQSARKNPSLTAFAFHTVINYHNYLKNTGRFNVSRGSGKFVLNDSNVEFSDTATYPCAVLYRTDIAFRAYTILVLRGEYKTFQYIL